MVYNYKELPQGTKDEGGKLVSLEGVAEFPAGISDKLSNDIAEHVFGIGSRGERVMVAAGMTSSGLLYVGNDVDVGKGVSGVSMQRIQSGEALSRFVDVEVLDGKPVSIVVPASATVSAVNQYLAKSFGPKFRVDYDITTSTTSHLGANLLTGGLGDNREALDVLDLTLITSGRQPKHIRNKAEIDALRGTQGYAGTVSRLRLRVIEDFANEELWVLPLNGDSVYGDSYAKVLAAVWEYMHFRNFDGIRIVGSEILHKSGTETIRRVVRHGVERTLTNPRDIENECRRNQAFASANWYDGMMASSKGGVLLRVRHDFDAPLSENFDHPFVNRIITLNERGSVADFSAFSSLEDKGIERIQRIDDLRAAVPEKAREEAAHADNFSKSMDVDVVIKVPRGVDPDSLRPAIERAHLATTIPFERADEIAESEGIIRIENGHELAVSREERPGRNVNGYFDGGQNRHKRFTAKSAKAKTVESICREIGDGLRALDGIEFGDGVVTHTTEGEKHYPSDRDALQHLADKRPSVAVARARAIADAGMTHSYRAPKATKSTIMRLVGGIAAK